MKLQLIIRNTSCRKPIATIAACLLIGFVASTRAQTQTQPEMVAPSGAQTQEAAARSLLPADPREMLLLSLSAEDYPVTPGDVYKLMYLTADTPVSLDVVVESDLKVNLGFFGKILARGLTFLELKQQIEQRVLRSYPKASPSVTIASNGVFQVHVQGEVVEAGEASAWALTRLSQIIGSYLTPYSSTRDVAVISASGAERRYDLFRALRFGEMQQDPYVSPGDVVVISKRDRSISLAGQAKRPGTYQPLAGEGLYELIEYYGDGFTVEADRSRVRVERLLTGSTAIAETFFIDLSAGYQKEIELRDMDTVEIPAKTERLPVVFIEGAIKPSSDPGSGPTPSGRTDDAAGQYSKFPVQVQSGATLYQILLSRKSQIYPNADLSHGYLIRRDPDEVITVDLEKLLFDYSPERDILLRAYDHLIIPFRRFSVTVTGAVFEPGVYAYAPNKTFQYYVDLAGGIDPERGRIDRVRVFDQTGRRLPPGSVLDSEGKVHVPYSFSYYAFKYVPIVAAAALAVLTGVYYLDQILK